MIGVTEFLVGFSFLAVAAPQATPENQVSPESNKATQGASQCDEVAGNIVVDCGFESGSLIYWYRYGPPIYGVIEGSPVAHSGNWGAKFNPPFSLQFISQVLSTTAGQSYVLSHWLRNEGRPSRFQLYWDGDLILDQVDCPAIPYAQFVVDDLVASSDSTELRFGFYNFEDYFWVDDIVVEGK
jgi:hypothetical protein